MATRRHRNGSHHRPAAIATLPWWMEAAETSCFEREQSSTSPPPHHPPRPRQAALPAELAVPDVPAPPRASEARVSTRGQGWAAPSSLRAARCLEMIRALVESGRYEFGAHVQSHMIEEGFDKEHCVGAVLGGRVLEVYVPPQQRRERERFLVAGRFHLSARNTCPLHIVCEFFQAPVAHPKPSPGQRGPGRALAEPEMEDRVRFVTAYIPRAPDWISPHVRGARV